MKNEGLAYNHIYPEYFGPFHPHKVPFLLLQNRGNNKDLLTSIVDHIKKIDPIKLRHIELQVDLMMVSQSNDANGNVCFAGDREMRPEYRVNFQALDLWDYYYALWHSSLYWNSEFAQKGEIPLPHRNKFWDMVVCGSKLRELHSSVNINESEGLPLEAIIAYMIKKFFPKFHNTKHQSSGSLTLDDSIHIHNIPYKSWNDSFKGKVSLKTWINDHFGGKVTSSKAKEFWTLQQIIDQTIHLQNNIDRFMKQEFI